MALHPQAASGQAGTLVNIHPPRYPAAGGGVNIHQRPRTPHPRGWERDPIRIFLPKHL